jgi:hypothetical protein
MASTLPPDYLDPNTPPDVVVTDVRPAPVGDPTLGVPLGPAGPDVPPVPDPPAHPLVTVGDSLAQGMISGAVFHTELSWPAQVAAALAIPGFAAPGYGGPLGGLPLNIEGLLRALQGDYGTDLSLIERLGLPVELQRLLDGNEDYWERGDGHLPPRTDRRWDNLGIYGWDVRDALSYPDARAAAGAAAPTHDDLTGAVPEHDNDIAAHSVLAPFGPGATQLGAAAGHGADGGIGVLVVALGANKALPTVVDKRVVWSADGYADLDRKGAYTVWRPTHFAAEYAELVARVRTIPARTVVLATVPHVTIAPIAKGVNPDDPGQKWLPGSRYFPYYTDPWVDEKGFDPNRRRHLTHQQARAIDSAIDQYNQVIVDAVREARGEGRDWRVLDLSDVLDGLSARRYADDAAAAARNHWAARALPGPIADLDTRFFLSDAGGRRQGGLFGLDGVHPTTGGYGVLAQAVLDVLAAPGATPVDFAALRARDTLNANPPALLSQVFDLLSPLLGLFLSRKTG